MIYEENAKRVHSIYFLVFLIFGLLFSGYAFAQPSLSGDRLISLPRGTVEGKLQNGLRYIILPNALPRHCVEVRMVMDVGSLQEEDDQRGGAHFLEHSALSVRNISLSFAN